MQSTQIQISSRKNKHEKYVSGYVFLTIADLLFYPGGT